MRDSDLSPRPRHGEGRHEPVARHSSRNDGCVGRQIRRRKDHARRDDRLASGSGAAEERAERAFMALGCTLIVVAHRMAATRRARRVLVMDGAGIDVGSHEELLARHELYADFHGLWRQA